MELIDQLHQNVELSHDAELFRDSSKAAIQLLGRRAIQRQ